MITAGDPIDLDTLRIRHEFLTVPDLRLSTEDVASVPRLSPRHAFAALETLVDESFLRRQSDGFYVRARGTAETLPELRQ
jgi:hypothetical protein